MKFNLNILILFLLAVLSYLPKAFAGTYLNSAHGDTSYGVERSSTAALGFARANCAHCHEQHSSIGGSEPAPVDGTPSPFTLFYGNNVSQTDNVCFRCHTDTSSLQTGGIVNRSYSYRAGAWTLDTVNDVKESFSFTSPATSHNLNDIQNFIDGRWGYNEQSTPCAACHNVHAAQGDPANAGNSTKSTGSRGYPVSRPSQHSWDNASEVLWGDEVGEKMSDYTGGYQAPYQYNSVVNYEPVGDTSTVTAAQNTTDFVTFCTDCHNNSNTIYSTTLGRNLRTIDWANEKHGGGAATNDTGNDVFAPYVDANLGTYVLACTDCHEPHGSNNVYLLREEVNGATPVTVVTLTSTNPGPTGTCNKEWVYNCGKCHTRLGGSDGHVHPSFIPPDTGGCSSGACHTGGCIYTPCGNCHYHGATQVLGTPYGEFMF